jgi:hypothetical protein
VRLLVGAEKGLRDLDRRGALLARGSFYIEQSCHAVSPLELGTDLGFAAFDAGLPDRQAGNVAAISSWCSPSFLGIHTKFPPQLKIVL